MVILLKIVKSVCVAFTAWMTFNCLVCMYSWNRLRVNIYRLKWRISYTYKIHAISWLNACFADDNSNVTFSLSKLLFAANKLMQIAAATLGQMFIGESAIYRGNGVFGPIALWPSEARKSHWKFLPPPRADKHGN